MRYNLWENKNLKHVFEVYLRLLENL